MQVSRNIGFCGDQQNQIERISSRFLPDLIGTRGAHICPEKLQTIQNPPDNAREVSPDFYAGAASSSVCNRI
jgi:hypothetical protein